VRPYPDSLLRNNFTYQYRIDAGPSGRAVLITRPEESYRLWCVVVCDLETTKILVNDEEAKAH